MSSRSPTFETNDLGFQRRADQRATNNWLQIRSDTPTGWFRQRTLNLSFWRGWNFDGDQLFGGSNVNGSVTFRNNWQLGSRYGVQQRDFDDRVTRGGPGLYVNGFRERWVYVNSDSRRPVSVNAVYDGGQDPAGSGWRYIEPSVTIRPVPAVMASIGVRFNQTTQDSQWVAQVTDTSDHYVFGHLQQTTLSFNGRFNYTLTPNLSMQLYAEPFVSAGAYGAFKELVNGRNPDYFNRYAPFAYDTDVNGNVDFNVKSFRTTNVLRWEYKPGSTLFVVWQLARANDAVPGGFHFGRDARDMFAVPPHNVFLVKFAYWLNY